MRSTKMEAKILKFLGIMFLVIAVVTMIFCVVLSIVLDEPAILIGSTIACLMFVITGLILLHSAKVSIRNREIAYAKGTVVQGVVSSIGVNRARDLVNDAPKNELVIMISFTDLDGKSVKKKLTDGRYYKKDDFKVGQSIELCLYNKFVLVN